MLSITVWHHALMAICKSITSCYCQMDLPLCNIAYLTDPVFFSIIRIGFQPHS